MDETHLLKLLQKNGVKETLCENVILVLQNLQMLSAMDELKPMDKGMTNQLFVFLCEGKRYMLRIPGEGTEYIVNRKHEAAVYEALLPWKITEEILYINAENGIKVSRFLDNVHTCNPENMDEVKRCISHLKKFHNLNLRVPHVFDVFAEIQLYERRCGVGIGEYEDCLETRSNIMELQQLLACTDSVWGLSHIDPVYDNFLLDNGEVYLIDWEYAGMSDVHIDLAMFCIYADYSKEKTDEILAAYFGETLTDDIRMKIYAYMSCCAYLWTLWCEIKKMEGIEYPAYEDGQYRIAKEFYGYAMELYRKRKQG